MFQRLLLLALGSILDVVTGLLDLLTDGCGCLIYFLASLFDRSFLWLTSVHANEQGAHEHENTEGFS